MSAPQPSSREGNLTKERSSLYGLASRTTDWWSARHRRRVRGGRAVKLAINRDKVTANAIKFLQAGKYDRAIAEFKKLVDDDPTDVRTLLKIGDTYVKMGHTQEAIGAYEQVATIYSDQGFYLKAVAVYKQMLRLDSTLPEIHLKLAEMYQQLNLSSDALQHYQQVAVFYEQQGRTQEALTILKRMVDLDPDNLPSRIKLAELFAQQGMSNEAIAEFRSATDYLKDQDRIDDYIRVAERLIYFDPSAIDVTREVAKIYLQRGDYKIALGKLQICFKADPRNLETLQFIGQAFSAMDQLPKAVSVFKEIARIHDQSSNTSEARTWWEKILGMSPGHAEAMQALGLAAPQVEQARPGQLPGQGAPAAPVAAPVAAVNPEEEQLRRFMTETDVYVKYGLRDKALEHLEKIIEMRPGHFEAYEKKKSISEALGNADGVVEALQRLVVLGEKANDSRTDGWRNELNAHNKPAAVLASIAPDEDDEEIVLDDHSLLLEPESDFGEPLGSDEPLSVGESLSKDLDLNAAAMSNLPADEGADAAKILLGDDDSVGYDDDAMFDAGTMVSAEDEALAAAAQSLLDDSPELSPSAEPLANDDGLDGDLYGALDDDVQQLVDDALEGVDDMGDLGDLDEALRVAESFIQEEEQEFFDNENVGYDDGNVGSDDAGLFDNFDASYEADGFDEGQVEEDYASTEIISLSPNELAEIRPFANQSQAASGVPDVEDAENAATEHFDAVPSTNLDARKADDDTLSDASMDSLLEAPLADLSLIQPDDDDLNAVAAAALGEVPPETDLLSRGALSDDGDESGEGKPTLGVSEQAQGFENDPATQFYPEEMEEAEFFIQQGILDEAREILEEINEDLEDSERAKWMLARVEALENDEDEPPAPWEKSLENSLQEELGDFDLEGALDSVLPEDDGQVSLDEVLSAFKKGVAETVADNDAETHYSLGIAYREMGLSSEAISEFELAAKNASKAPDSLNLIGLCHQDNGAFDKALASFESSLACEGINSKQQGTNEYQRGICLLELSRPQEAVGAFKGAQRLKSDMPDLAKRLKAAEDAAQGIPPPSGVSRQTKNIDYV
ncbi:MAG: tetratricopeptide repeat protein [Deltaproteobacteria bacterium]|nr:tetratricopeptide repeat protein [Deltaproteobacteria bacterium]